MPPMPQPPTPDAVEQQMKQLKQQQGISLQELVNNAVGTTQPAQGAPAAAAPTGAPYGKA
jgi:DNA-binding protein H-NS